MSDAFQPEQVIGGRYRVVRKLGGGGMADVYLCEDLTLGRHVAIKVLLQRYLNDPTFVERFRREAKAAAGLNQQNLVSIYDWGEVDGTYFIVMEYVEGETLKDLIRRRGRLSGNESVAVTLQLLRRGRLRAPQRHRAPRHQAAEHHDRPRRDREGHGLRHRPRRRLGMTEAGSILGTAQYLAPEQAKGYPVDERSDLYSVGVVPLRDAHRHRARSRATAPSPSLSSTSTRCRCEPSELVPGHAVRRSTRSCSRRWPRTRPTATRSAAEFARDLRAAKEGGPVQAAAFDAGGRAHARDGAPPAAAGRPADVLDSPCRPAQEVQVAAGPGHPAARDHRRRRRRACGGR